MKKYEYRNYSDYVKYQKKAAKKKHNYVWAKKENIIDIVDAVKTLLPDFRPEKGICHGARTGKEVSWFKKYFGCGVVGTDIRPSHNAKIKLLAWDMHDIKYAWIGVFDFVYSNSWDHFYDPEYGFKNWGLSCKPGGLIILEYSDKHTDEYVSEIDSFGLNEDEMIDYISGILIDFKFIVDIEFKGRGRALIWQKAK